MPEVKTATGKTANEVQVGCFKAPRVSTSSVWYTYSEVARSYMMSKQESFTKIDFNRKDITSVDV